MAAAQVLGTDGQSSFLSPLQGSFICTMLHAYKVPLSSIGLSQAGVKCPGRGLDSNGKLWGQSLLSSFSYCYAPLLIVTHLIQTFPFMKDKCRVYYIKGLKYWYAVYTNPTAIYQREPLQNRKQLPVQVRAGPYSTSFQPRTWRCCCWLLGSGRISAAVVAGNCTGKGLAEVVVGKNVV